MVPEASQSGKCFVAFITRELDALMFHEMMYVPGGCFIKSRFTAAIATTVVILTFAFGHTKCFHFKDNFGWVVNCI